jgi:hypothetical protein
VRAVTWWCARCLRESGRVSSARLCVACRALGWRWCSAGQHVVRRVVSGRCPACGRARMRKAPPPAGYLPVKEAARRLGYSATHLTRLAQWGRVRAFQRTKRGPWYVEVPS